MNARITQLEHAIAEIFEQLTDPDRDPLMPACRAIRDSINADPTTPGTVMVPTDALASER